VCWKPETREIKKPLPSRSAHQNPFKYKKWQQKKRRARKKLKRIEIF
jgi:hypothetical protein